jgi:hypothetical protein
MGPAGQVQPQQGPVQPNPKNGTNANGSFHPTPKIKTLDETEPPLALPVPVPVPVPKPTHRRWLIGGGSSLAVLLAIFLMGKTFWKSSNDTEVVAATRGKVTDPIPTPDVRALNQDTPNLQAITILQTPKKVLPPALKPVQAVKQPAPNLAEVKPKPKPKLPTEASARANTEADEDRNAGLRSDKDPLSTTMKSAIDPNATRFAFREPPAGMKAASEADATAWRNAKLNGEAEAYKKYLDAQPKGAYRNFAKERWDGLREENDWHQVQDRKSWDGYHKHMQKYPQGRHAQEAEQRKKELEAKRNEPK